MKVLSSFLWGSEMTRVRGAEMQAGARGPGDTRSYGILSFIQFEGPSLRKKMISVKSDMKANAYLE